MIDRGDLAAEVGNEKLTEYVENIIKDCKFYGKPIIIATENLNSLINNLTPSKSDILNLDYYISKKSRLYNVKRRNRDLLKLAKYNKLAL